MQLGHFEIVELIGEGAFGVVYRARRDGREVALKVMHAGEGEISPTEIARFVAEAEKMVRVRHPSLVSLEETGTLPDGRPFLSMPLLGDRSIAAQVLSTPFAPEDALALFDGLAGAVTALHDAGLIHRDIKPENVMVLADRLVLLDLGIARDVAAAPSTTTRAGMSRGTPAYMAPERLLGQAATIASDVYELALVLVVMVLGTTPWPEGDASARFKPSLAGTRIPAAWVPLLEDALSLDVTKRPKAAADLVRVLEAATPGQQEPPRAERVTRDRLGFAPTELVPSSEQASSDARYASTASDARLVRSVPPPAATNSVWWYFGVVLVLGIGVGGVAFGRWMLRERSSPTSSPAIHTAESVFLEAKSADAPVVDAPVMTASSVASGSAWDPQASSTVKASPTAKAPATTSAAATASAAAAPTLAACQQLVALMCSKTSGARPEECTAWKANAAKWARDLPANVAADTCKAAFDASSAGLAHRRAATPPTP